MKPPPFEYIAPSSLEEALAAIAADGEAKVLAGGQSLVPLMNLRLAAPEQLVDLNALDGLDTIGEADGGVSIGAMTRQSAAEQSALVQERVPALAEALARIGHFQVRNRGTVGGSIAHADPVAELPATLLALGGRVTAASAARGERQIGADDLFQGFFTTALEADEILTETWWPALAAGSGWSVQEVVRRTGDFALVSAVTLLRVDGGSVADARIAMGGVAARPTRVTTAEEAITGQAPSEDAARAAGDAARASVNPTGDVHGSAEYRREVAGVLVERSIIEAAGRAQG